MRPATPLQPASPPWPQSARLPMPPATMQPGTRGPPPGRPGPAQRLHWIRGRSKRAQPHPVPRGNHSPAWLPTWPRSGQRTSQAAGLPCHIRCSQPNSPGAIPERIRALPVSGTASRSMAGQEPAGPGQDVIEISVDLLRCKLVRPRRGCLLDADAKAFETRASSQAARSGPCSRESTARASDACRAAWKVFHQDRAAAARPLPPPGRRDELEHLGAQPGGDVVDLTHQPLREVHETLLDQDLRVGDHGPGGRQPHAIGIIYKSDLYNRLATHAAARDGRRALRSGCGPR